MPHTSITLYDEDTKKISQISKLVSDIRSPNNSLAIQIALRSFKKPSKTALKKIINTIASCDKRRKSSQ